MRSYSTRFKVFFRVSDCCLTLDKQYIIMARTSYILMRWWWCPFCTRPSYLVGFL